MNTTTCIHFVETLSFFQTKNNFYSIMELLDGKIKDLLDFLGLRSLNSEVYINILIQMLYTIYCLHTLNISHNDIHYGNILFMKVKSPNLSNTLNSTIQDYLINGINTININYFEYNIDGANIRIKNMGFIIKFIDFGFSTLDKKINDMTFLIRPSKLLSIEGQNYKEFNRNTDLITWTLNFIKFTDKTNFSLSNYVTFEPNIITIASEIEKVILNNNKDYFNTNVIHRNNKSHCIFVVAMTSQSLSCSNLNFKTEAPQLESKARQPLQTPQLCFPGPNFCKN
jgi:hypothetical protein